MTGRLIDADELFVKWQTTMMKIGEPVSVLYILAAMSDLQQAPTVEAEPVTRCKDCKYSVDEYDDGECYCDYNRELRYIKDWDHYCSWAEGKEG